MHAPKVFVCEQGLSMDEFQQVVSRTSTVALSPETVSAVENCRSFLEEEMRQGRIIYGVNTGFGNLSTVILSENQTQMLQKNLIRSHACAVGEPFSEEVVRAMILLRLLSLARGHSGIRPIVLECLIACLNLGVHPVIPQQGSLGASGDLAPLAHLALVLIGEGEAYYQGERMTGAEACQRAGIKALTLRAKEGLALINGTQAMLAVGLLAYQKARYLAEAANAIAALTLQALDGITDAFAEAIQSVRPFPEQASVAHDIRCLIHGSKLTAESSKSKVQDAYSLRCIPQVHGATLRALHHVDETLCIEMNSVTDNPLLFPADGKVYSGGNFHGQPIALAMDYMKIAVSELANISERRIERLVNPQLNGNLPPFLTPNAGVSSGFMILQYVAASLVSENKVLAHPASVDSIPSSGNQEDHVSMGATAARQANMVVENTAKVLAIELICAAQACEWKGTTKLSEPSQRVVRWLRTLVKSHTDDRSYSTDIECVANVLMGGDLNLIVKDARSAT